jgi:hypothetical protein
MSSVSKTTSTKVTVDHAARLIGISRATCFRWISSGALQSIGSRPVYIPIESLTAAIGPVDPQRIASMPRARARALLDRAAYDPDIARSISRGASYRWAIDAHARSNASPSAFRVLRLATVGRRQPARKERSSFGGLSPAASGHQLPGLSRSARNNIFNFLMQNLRRS